VPALLLSLASCTRPPAGPRRAEQLYSERCAGCHPLPRPESYGPAEWPGILSDMALPAGLSVEEEQVLLRWVSEGRKP